MDLILIRGTNGEYFKGPQSRRKKDTRESIVTRTSPLELLKKISYIKLINYKTTKTRGGVLKRKEE